MGHRGIKANIESITRIHPPYRFQNRQEGIATRASTLGIDYRLSAMIYYWLSHSLLATTGINGPSGNDWQSATGAYAMSGVSFLKK